MFNWVNCHALTYIPKISTQGIFGPNKWYLNHAIKMLWLNTTVPVTRP